MPYQNMWTELLRSRQPNTRSLQLQGQPLGINPMTWCRVTHRIAVTQFIFVWLFSLYFGLHSLVVYLVSLLDFFGLPAQNLEVLGQAKRSTAEYPDGVLGILRTHSLKHGTPVRPVQQSFPCSGMFVPRSEFANALQIICQLQERQPACKHDVQGHSCELQPFGTHDARGKLIAVRHIRT